MSDFGGMTVNERIFAAGLIAAWDYVVESREEETLREILAKVELTDQADVIVASAIQRKP